MEEFICGAVKIKINSAKSIVPLEFIITYQDQIHFILLTLMRFFFDSSEVIRQQGRKNLSSIIDFNGK